MMLMNFVIFLCKELSKREGQHVNAMSHSSSIGKDIREWEEEEEEEGYRRRRISSIVVYAGRSFDNVKNLGVLMDKDTIGFGYLITYPREGVVSRTLFVNDVLLYSKDKIPDWFGNYQYIFIVVIEQLIDILKDFLPNSGAQP